MQLVIVSGLSGAGKTVALKQFEDLGYTCIDNIPLALLDSLTGSKLKSLKERYERMAVGIDARLSPDEIQDFPLYLDKLRADGVDVHVLFLNADDEVILRRYSETRRPHPLTSSGLSLTDAITRERELLAPIANTAQEVIETTSLNLHELREEIARRMPESGSGRLAVTFMSFGFKNGAPDIADFVFDVRCLPNPHWEPALRAESGLDEGVREFLGRHEDVRRMIQDLRDFLERWLPRFEEQDRAYVTIAIGCTGGRHRSVYIAEQLAQAFSDRYDAVTTKHRELHA